MRNCIKGHSPGRLDNHWITWRKTGTQTADGSMASEDTEVVGGLGHTGMQATLMAGVSTHCEGTVVAQRTPSKFWTEVGNQNADTEILTVLECR